MIGMPGPMELAIIGGILLLLFGNRLPKVARSIGSSIVEFKRGVKGIEDEVDGVANEFRDIERTVKEKPKDEQRTS